MPPKKTKFKAKGGSRHFTSEAEIMRQNDDIKRKQDKSGDEVCIILLIYLFQQINQSIILDISVILSRVWLFIRRRATRDARCADK